MACQVCLAHGWDHEGIVDACRKSIYETGIILGKFERLPRSPLHKEVFDQIQEWYEEGHQDVLLMLPRDFLKTTFLACMAAWGWINNPELRIYLFHSSSKQASKLVPVLQRIILDSPMKHFFPSLIPDMKRAKWTNSDLEIARQGNYTNASMEAKGVGSIVTGGHVNWQFHDDLVEQGAADSDAEIQGVMRFYQTTPALFDDPIRYFNLVCGTLWKGGFYEELMGQGIYKVIVLGAEADKRYFDFFQSRGKTPEIEMGDPIWPEFFPAKVLEKLRLKMGPVDYSRQFLNLPSDEIELTFRPEDIRWCSFIKDAENWVVEAPITRHDRLTGEPRTTFLRMPLKTGQVTVTCDPATGEKRSSDESALNVGVNFPTLGYAVVIEEWSGNVLPAQLIDKIFAMMIKYRPIGARRLGIEQVGYQVTLKRWLESEMIRRNFFFSIDMISTKNRAKKDRMVESIQPWVASHKLLFTRQAAGLVRQLTNIRVVGGNLVGRSPNKVDALAMQCQQYWRYHGETIDDPNYIEEAVDVAGEKTTRKYGLELMT